MRTAESQKNLEIVQFSPGEMIFEEGDSGFFFYIIQEGQVEVYKKIQQAEKKILGILGPGQPLGEFALITESLRSASARAVTKVEAVRVSEAGYKDLLMDLPEWAIALISSLIRRLKDANEALTLNLESERAFSELFDEKTEVSYRNKN